MKRSTRATTVVKSTLAASLLTSISLLSASAFAGGAVTIVGGKVIGSKPAVVYVDNAGDKRLATTDDSGHDIQMGYNLPMDGIDTATWHAAVSVPAASYKKDDELIIFSMDSPGFK